MTALGPQGRAAGPCPVKVRAVGAVPRAPGRHFWFTWFSAGGTGALRGQDGLSVTAYPSGVAGVAAEVIETLAPIVLRRRDLRPDSGGAGTFRGGLGRVMDRTLDFVKIR